MGERHGSRAFERVAPRGHPVRGETEEERERASDCDHVQGLIRLQLSPSRRGESGNWAGKRLNEQGL